MNSSFSELFYLFFSRPPGPKFDFVFSHKSTNKKILAWPRGYKTYFILIAAEHKIYPAHKC